MENRPECVVYKTEDIEKVLNGLNNINVTGINNIKIVAEIFNILEKFTPEKTVKGGD